MTDIESPTGDPHPFDDEVLLRMKKSIFELPLPALTNGIRKELDMENGSTAAALARIKLDDAIDLLNNECCLGNQDAVRGLATLGLRINSILFQFIGDPTQEVYGGSSTSDSASVNDRSTSEMEAEIADSIKNIRNHPPISLRQWFDREKNSNDAIYFPAKLASLKGETNDPPMKDDGVPDDSGLGDKITEILQHVVGQRLFRESRVAALEVAGDSLFWPVSIPAINEKRDELHTRYISKLPVGANLPFRVGRKTAGKRGRSFKQGSCTAFTEAIFGELTIERKTFLRTIPPEQRDALNSFTTGEPVQVEPNRQPAWMQSISGSMTNGANEMQDLNNTWRKKVEMLKPLQCSNVDSWVDAGVTFCKSECAGIWDEYLSIRCVVGRAKSKPEQTTETCVTEILKRGAKQLSKRNQ